MRSPAEDEAARALASLHAAFETLKADFRDERFPVAAGRLAGEALAWGGLLLSIYRAEGREELERRDALTRFWVLRFRGMPQPADLAEAPPGAAFVLAFTAFPYFDGMMDLWSLGGNAGTDEAGRILVTWLADGVDDGRMLAAERAEGGWQFDLMPLYAEKAQILDRFVAAQFEGDFDRFMRQYAADHDLAFDLEQAWRPLEGG